MISTKECTLNHYTDHPCAISDTQESLATAILTRKLTANSLLVDDSVIDDHSTVMLNSAKMEELGLFNGDTVLLKGKKRKNTVAVVTADNLVSESRVRMSKVIRSNLRYKFSMR